MIYDAKIDKPETDHGISDPVNVFLDDGRVHIAWWDERDNFWHDEAGNRFTNIKWWSYIKFPKTWDYNPALYGGSE